MPIRTTFTLSLAAAGALATGTSAETRPADIMPLALTMQAAQTMPPGANASDSLDRPEMWTCARYQPEYRRWIDEGNSPESWRYAGRTYTDSVTGRTYTWQDWLAWADANGCGATVADTGGVGLPTSSIAIGLGITALGVGLLAAGSGSGPNSPG